MYRLEKRNHPRNRFRKNSLRRQEANHQIPIARKIKEVPRMHVNIPRSNQLNSQLLIRPRNRHAQNRIPPPLKPQPRTSRLPSKLPIQLSKIPPPPPHQPPLKLTPPLKKRTQNNLHRRIQRNKSILNTHQHAPFIFGIPQILDIPLKAKVSAGTFPANPAKRSPLKGKSKNTSSAIIPSEAREQISFKREISATLQKCPVGLLG